MSRKMTLRVLAGFVLIALSFALSSTSFAYVGEWTMKADMPTRRSWFSSSVVNEKIYAIGGWLEGERITAVEEYDPATNTWTKKADLPAARAYLSTCAVDGKIYVIGGSDRTRRRRVD
ncbi:MAG: Kelch repeat-containing protein, partial [Planctomycetota bacterium]